MRTDSILVQRLASELTHRFAGARVRDVGQLGGGRFALALWKKGRTELLYADVFAATPFLAVEMGELPIATEPGFVRAAGAALRGKTISGVTAVKNERILRVEFAAQSRFGVRDEYTLLFELVPRFGNIVLLKGDTIVAALKEFASTRAARRIRAGQRYEPPPPRARSSSPPAGDVGGDLYVYRDAQGSLVQAHVEPLSEFRDLACERSASLLDLFAEMAAAGSRAHASDAHAVQRAEAERGLAARERSLVTEREHIDERLAEAAMRDELRARGDAIYATLHELPEASRSSAKSEAAELFARYRKAGAATGHLTRRRAGVARSLDEIAELRWELQRAGPEELPEVLETVSGLRPGRKKPKRRVRAKRLPLEYAVSRGSRVLVGRSPAENADLTFRVARPDDLWFHVRGQPGAHVILKRDDRQAPPPEDIVAAAELAAFHSKARNNANVIVDYTQRKHVRKRPAAAPGLVVYTDASSLSVVPKERRFDPR